MPPPAVPSPTTSRTPRWLGLSVQRPRTTLLVATALVLVAATGLPRLTLRTDGRALAPRRAPAVALDAAVRQEFGVKDLILVVAETDDPRGIYNSGTLAWIRDLTARLPEIEGIGPNDITSLATEKAGHFAPGTSRALSFLEPFPDTPGRQAWLRDALAGLPIYEGTLVSHDGTAAAVLVDVPGIEPGHASGNVRARIREDIDALLDELRSTDDRIHVVGAPVAETLLGLHILNDLALLVPIALAVIFLVLFAAGRSIWAAILPLVEVGAGLVFTFGIMGWVGTPIYLTTTIVPVILIAIGVADEIHIFHRYRQVSGETAGGDATPSIVRTLLEMRRPVISTSLTSSLGFLSFVASPIGPVKMFGVYTALGILFCLAWSLFAIPAALRLLGPERVELRSSVSPRTDPWAPRVALAVRRHRSPILIAFALLALAAPFGIRRIVVQDSWIDAFARSSEFRTSTERVNGLFDGTHLLRVRWRTRPGGLLDLEEVRRLKRFEEFLDARTDVGGVLGPHEFMSTVHFVAAGRREEARQLDAEDRTPERALRLAAHYHGLSRRNQIVEPTNSAALVTLFLKDANFVETRGLMAAIRDYERRELGPFGIQLAFAGDVAVSQAMIAAVTETQVSSLLFCLAGVLLVSLALTRSWRDGTLTVVPAAIAAGLMFALLGWARIPLGVATSMFGAISVGIGVDYAIHFLDRIRHAEQAGLDRERSVVEAARIAGPAILMDAGAIAGGFAVLFFSRIPANHRLGGLVVLCVVTCVIATLVVIPALRAGPRAPVRKAPGP